MIKRYLEIASKNEVLAISMAGCLTLIYFMSDGMFPVSAIKPGMDISAAENALGIAAKKGLLNAYALRLLTLDTIFPIFYATLLCGLIYRSNSVTHRMWIALAPMVLAIWDYCENVQLVLIHLWYPDNPVSLISSALLFGKGKLIGIIICFIILLVSWGCRILRQYKGIRSNI